MTGYLLPLLAIVVLCGAWAVFQIWLDRHDPEAKRRSLKCGACSRRDECGDEKVQQEHDPASGSRSGQFRSEP